MLFSFFVITLDILLDKQSKNMHACELIGEYTAMASNAIHLLLKRKTHAQA